MIFTGGDGLTGFKRSVHKVFMNNELKNGEGAYEVSHAMAGRSGYSFGPVQWDLLNRPDSRTIFTDILKNGRDSGDDLIFDSDGDGIIGDTETKAINDIISVVTTKGETLDKDQRDLINGCLSSTYGIRKINEAYQTELDTAITKTDGIINKVADTENKAFLQTDLGRLFLIDYNNQFNISPNKQMERFLQGETVIVGENPPVQVKINGNLGIEDLMDFCLNTKYGQNHPGDLIRRFSNILEEVGVNNISLTQEDAIFLLTGLDSLLGERYKEIVMLNSDNWGIRNLIQKAFTMVADNSARFNGIDYWQRLRMNEIISSAKQVYGVSKSVQSPIALDLDGDGTETNHVNDGAYFDHDANGFAEQTGWVGSDDGILVYDRNNDGIIDVGTETFGNNTPLLNGNPAANGFVALAELDGNLDGKIDSQDAIWNNLKIWQDFDGDGYSAADELWSLSEVRVASINTSYTDSAYIDPNGNEHRQVGSFTQSDGTIGDAADVWFVVNRAFSIANEWLAVPEEIAALPDLQGYGNIYDLHQAIVRDTGGGIRALVESYVAESDPDARTNLMEQIILKWTGCEGVDPDSRGPGIDGRKLSVLEKLFADEFYGWGGEDPTLNAGTILNHCYKGIFEMYYADLSAQTHLKGLYDKIAYTWDETTQSLKGDLSSAISTLQDQLITDRAAGKVMLGEFARSLRGFQLQHMVDYWGFRSVFAGEGEELSWVFDSGGHNIVVAGGSATGFCDAIQGSDGNDSLSGNYYNFYISTSGVLHGGPGNDTLTGNNGSDLLVGGLGDDTLVGEYHSFAPGGDILDGGPGNDSLQGGEGRDLYLFDHGYGEDTVSDFDTITGNVDTLKFASDIARSDVEITRNWNTLVFRIRGTADQVLVPSGIAKSPRQVERIEFGDGTVLTGDEVTAISEEIRGTSGNDAVTGSSIRDRIYGEAGNDTIYGYTGDDLIEGGPGNDTLNGCWYQMLGYDGNDTLDGGPGNDTLQDGLGNDTYLFGRGYGTDTISDYDTTSGNRDKIRFHSDVLPGDVNVTREGNNLVFDINGSPDRITVLRHFYYDSYKAEQVEFGDGIDFDLFDIQLGTAGNDNLTGGPNDTLLMGESGSDILNGDGGNDLINGGAGTDTLIGGYGDDTYIVDDLSDAITEAIGEGADRVFSSVTFSLGSNIENLTLTGICQINATGNELNNVLSGNSVANVLTGGRGDDSYIIGPGDMVIENPDEGTDTIISTESFALPGNVENLTLTGSGNHNATGNALDNVLDGNSGSNILDGIGGTDQMRGGRGDDTYVVENPGDTVIEDPNRGRDTILSSIDWILGANIENLTLVGTDSINGRGNALENILIGNTASNLFIGASGDDILDGGPGNDFLEGGLGNDLYLFNRGYDKDKLTDDDGNEDTLRFALDVEREDVEIIREGDGVLFTIKGTSDQVRVPEWMTRPSNRLEKIEFGDGTLLSGDEITELFKEIRGTSGNDYLKGTSETNRIYGLEGNDILNGYAGDDLLVGGPGDDTYIVDSIGDAVNEAPDEGTDTVQSSIDYTLGENLENLTLLSGALHGGGNELDNYLIGNDSANLLEGEEGDDTLDGGGRADYLSGGFGNDVYFVDDSGDMITEEGYQGFDAVLSSISYALGPNLEKVILSGTDGINATGNELANVLIGNSGENVLDGCEGDDEMIGAAGDDTYIVGFGDAVFENPDEGVDTVQSSIDYTLNQNVENLILTGSASKGTGNGLNNTLIGNTEENILDGQAGADWMNGGEGDDFYVVDNVSDKVIEESSEGIDSVESSVTYALGQNIENLILVGTDAINGTGNHLDNILTGNVGANILGGGPGNDMYIVGSGDIVVEKPEEGIDAILSPEALTLPANVENGTLTGTADADVEGNELDNLLIGNSGANMIDGSGGADAMMGGEGDDCYFVDNPEDRVFENVSEGIDTIRSGIDWTLGPNIENLTLIGTAVNGIGNELDNVLIGDAADNNLDGGVGFDVSIGGLGSDIYVVDDAGDIVIELAGEGTDLILSSINYTVGDNVEDLTLTGNAVVAVGNALNNVLTGDNAPNELQGGKGDDTYIAGSGDRVFENRDEGIDVVQSAVDWTLDPNVENLILTGTDAINGTGNELGNILTGNSAPNILAGGCGDDTYIIGLGDTVVEYAVDGVDTILSPETLTLPANVENGALIGTTDTNVRGNELDNLLIGNNYSNIIDGKAGADTMVGGLGNDIYMVEDREDIVTEASDEGRDTVQSSISYSLGANVENLILVGNDWINGTGNELGNLLTGNSSLNILSGEAGDDTLDGGGGIDVLIGGLGNDTYVVSRPWDMVVEDFNEGEDTVEGSINYTLGANVENLVLTGDAKLGNGNHLDNELKGNASSNLLMGHKGNDRLLGGAGDDHLDGGAGEDILDGGPGVDVLKGDGDNDTYLFGRGYGEDTISEHGNYKKTGEMDRVRFNFGLNPIDLIFVKKDKDLSIMINDSTDQLTVENQNQKSGPQVEVFETFDGRRLLASEIGLLIQEMAGFSRETRMNWEQLIELKPDQVQQILTQYWEPAQ
ncbi:MAG: calcium-binding protein [Thermodesulfobacteriota bacterium]